MTGCRIQSTAGRLLAFAALLALLAGLGLVMIQPPYSIAAFHAHAAEAAPPHSAEQLYHLRAALIADPGSTALWNQYMNEPGINGSAPAYSLRRMLPGMQHPPAVAVLARPLGFALIAAAFAVFLRLVNVADTVLFLRVQNTTAATPLPLKILMLAGHGAHYDRAAHILKTLNGRFLLIASLAGIFMLLSLLSFFAAPPARIEALIGPMTALLGEMPGNALRLHTQLFDLGRILLAGLGFWLVQVYALSRRQTCALASLFTVLILILTWFILLTDGTAIPLLPPEGLTFQNASIVALYATGFALALVLLEHIRAGRTSLSTAGMGWAVLGFMALADLLLRPSLLQHGLFVLCWTLLGLIWVRAQSPTGKERMLRQL